MELPHQFYNCSEIFVSEPSPDIFSPLFPILTAWVCACKISISRFSYINKIDVEAFQYYRIILDCSTSALR